MRRHRLARLVRSLANKLEDTMNEHPKKLMSGSFFNESFPDIEQAIKMSEMAEKTSQKRRFQKKIRQELQSHLSPERLGRVTGSEFKDIGFKQKKCSKTDKQSRINWILTRPSGKLLLDKQVRDCKKESYMKLKTDEILEVYDLIEGDFVMTGTCEKYMYKLIHEAATGKMHYTGDSKATLWGKQNEPKALQRYMADTKKNVRNVGFQISKKMGIAGCTPDGAEIDSPDINSEYNIIGLQEVKCPFNGLYHEQTMDKRVIDERYVPQCHFQIFVTGAQWLDFISYDPRQTNPKDQICMIRIWRKNIIEELRIIERNLLLFRKIYLEKLKLRGLTLKV